MISKISQVLIESEKTRKKIKGKLISDEGYCALGALACEKGLITRESDDLGAENEIGYNAIIEAYGVNPYLMVDFPVKNSGYDNRKFTLVNAIWHLNDGHHNWSFKKIGKWIKKLEDKGVIEYED